jgi:hypothetical protein
MYFLFASLPNSGSFWSGSEKKEASGYVTPPEKF